MSDLERAGWSAEKLNKSKEASAGTISGIVIMSKLLNCSRPTMLLTNSRTGPASRRAKSSRSVPASTESGWRPSELPRSLRHRTKSLVPNLGSAAEKLSAIVDRLQKSEALTQAAQRTAPRQPSPAPLARLPDAPVAFKAKGQRLLIEVTEKGDRSFIVFVEQSLGKLYEEWKSSKP